MDDERWEEVEWEIIRRDALYRLTKGLPMDKLTDPNGDPIDPKGILPYASIRLSRDYLKILVEISKSPPRQSVAGMYCEKCNQRTVISKKVQIRAGDEGENEEYICLNCKNRYVK